MIRFGGPLLYHGGEDQQRSFDSTDKKFRRFLTETGGSCSPLTHKFRRRGRIFIALAIKELPGEKRHIREPRRNGYTFRPTTGKDGMQTKRLAKFQTRQEDYMMKTDNRGGFKKGRSGNPAGRPCGSRNQAQLECEELLQAAAPALMKVLIEKALKGNMQGLRLCIERLYPAPKDQPLQLTFPAIESAKYLLPACQELTKTLAGVRQISAAEGQSLAHILASYVPILEAADDGQQLIDLERHLAESRTMNSSCAILRRTLTAKTGESPK